MNLQGLVSQRSSWALCPLLSREQETAYKTVLEVRMVRHRHVWVCAWAACCTQNIQPTPRPQTGGDCGIL